MKSNMTTLCYIEQNDAYLMLHRVTKDGDINRDKWLGVGGHFEAGESPEDCLLREERPFFSLKLCYEGEELVEAVLDGTRIIHARNQRPVAHERCGLQ